MPGWMWLLLLGILLLSVDEAGAAVVEEGGREVFPTDWTTLLMVEPPPPPPPPAAATLLEGGGDGAAAAAEGGGGGRGRGLVSLAPPAPLPTVGWGDPVARTKEDGEEGLDLDPAGREEDCPILLPTPPPCVELAVLPGILLVGVATRGEETEVASSCGEAFDIREEEVGAVDIVAVVVGLAVEDGGEGDESFRLDEPPYFFLSIIRSSLSRCRMASLSRASCTAKVNLPSR